MCDESLYIEKYTDGKPALFTSIHRSEGDVICGVSQLLFDSWAKLQVFLGSGGNAALADRLLKVTDVVLEEDGASQPVFGVMVGAAGSLRHHAGLRRGGPNVVFVAYPMAGVGDGFVKLVARTRTKGGIRANSLLAADFGTDWVATDSTHLEPAAKKMRGLLDIYFQNSQKAAAESTAACPSAQIASADDKKNAEEDRVGKCERCRLPRGENCFRFAHSANDQLKSWLQG